MIGLARIVPVALTVAFIQVATIDRLSWPVIGQVDLPLTLALVLLAARPDRAAEIGFVVGLIVDLLHTRLFGLHAMAYVAMGPAAGLTAYVGPRSESARTAVAVGSQAVVGSALIVVGAWLGGATGRPGWDRAASVAQTALLATLSVLWVRRSALRAFLVDEPGVAGSPIGMTGHRSVPLGPAGRR